MVAWYRKSAEHGDAVGMYGLGLMYENGTGVEKAASNKRSEWHRKAAKLGEQRAIDALKRLGVSQQ